MSRKITYAVIGGPLDGALLTTPNIVGETHRIQLDAEVPPLSLSRARANDVPVSNTFTYYLHGLGDPDRLLQWASPADMSEGEALIRILADRNALEAALRAYTKDHGT